MKKLLSFTFAALFLICLVLSACFLFHIGGSPSVTNLEYDQFAAIAFIQSALFFLLYLRTERILNN